MYHLCVNDTRAAKSIILIIYVCNTYTSTSNGGSNMNKTLWLKLSALLLVTLMLVSLFACEIKPGITDTSTESSDESD